MIDLPVTEIFDDLDGALAAHTAAVLMAPPGAGKSTAVPLFLKDAQWLSGRKIVMLAPRRLAARAAARRMAHMLGERVGRTVGYRVRLDTRIGPHTRIEVVTEGVLTRMLQNDPALDGVGLVIFDEFHERSLNADVGLALCLDIQGILNADLKLLVMSATMDSGPVASLLGQAPVIEARGRTHPIETRYLGGHSPTGDLKKVAAAVCTALRQEQGSILVFLPGAAEIRMVAHLLEQAQLASHIHILPLLGGLSAKAQDRAISPPKSGQRKVVLATAIAETSLTIEGIGVVVDSGLQRFPRFDVGSGMSRLVTMAVSKASADQRRGRAGRLGPGACLRLWSEAANRALVPDRRPEILETDLCSLVLTLAGWGVGDPLDLKWLDPPPEGAFDRACDLLRDLNALDQDNRTTRHGREMALLPMHPRLAHMVLMARQNGQGRAACDLAALLAERDPLWFYDGCGEADMRLRFDLIQARREGRPFTIPAARIDENACRHIIRIGDQMSRPLGRFRPSDTAGDVSLGRLLAWAYPDRIARRRPETRGRYLMAGGQGVRLDAKDPLAGEEYIVAVETDGRRQDGRIFRAAAYDRNHLEEQFADRLEQRSEIGWDAGRRAVTSRKELRLGALLVSVQPIHQPDENQVMAAMMEGIAQNGIAALPWSRSLRNLQARVCFLHNIPGIEGGWPDLSDQNLIADLEWLTPCLGGVSSLRDLAGIDLRSALVGQLTYTQHRQLDMLAPTHWVVPSGSRIAIDYGGKVPVMAVRLQEMFGLEQTPTIAGGRQPLLIHLLSPAGRPVQVTQDLAGFWRSTYHEVKKELKGRYPKHYWPDDPMSAIATARVRPKP
ncbi:MAG: ATP-dependent helicase HrpB [Desulfobacteraceae bacterium]